MKSAAQAIFSGVLILLVGTIPRNLLFAANLRHFPNIPWAIPVIALWVWCLWRYLQGSGPPVASAVQRRTNLRANSLPVAVWGWALFAGGLGIVALVLALRLVNHFIVLPEQQLPNLAGVPDATIVALLVMAAPVAAIIEEAAFRGYMQRPLETRFGVAPAILITGTMFGLVHLDFTWILWPYYLAVAAIYGTVTYLTSSILPAVVLHTVGNLYSNFDLWSHGTAEWQAAAGARADGSLWMLPLSLIAVTAVMVWAYLRLADATVQRQYATTSRL